MQTYDFVIPAQFHLSMETPLDEEGYYCVDFIEMPKRVVDIKGLDSSGKERHAVIMYEEKFYSAVLTKKFFSKLLSYGVDGLHDGGNMYGVEWKATRKNIQISDPGIAAYRYTGSAATQTEPFTKYPIINKIRKDLYERTGFRFNFCLYNYYPLDSKLGWHSDAEDNMVEFSPICSLSFGFERRFRVKSIEDNSILFDRYLKSGSLLIMDKGCQKLTQHCVWPLTEKQISAVNSDRDEDVIRINLTFRMMKPQT